MTEAIELNDNVENTGKKRARSDDSGLENVPPLSTKSTVKKLKSAKLDLFFKKEAKEPTDRKIAEDAMDAAKAKKPTKPTNQKPIADFFRRHAKTTSPGTAVRIFAPYSGGCNASIADARAIGRLKVFGGNVDTAALAKRPWRMDVQRNLHDLSMDNWFLHWEIAYITSFWHEFRPKLTRGVQFTTEQLAAELCSTASARIIDKMLTCLVRNIWRAVKDRNLPVWGPREYLRYLNFIVNGTTPSSGTTLPKSVWSLFVYLRNSEAAPEDEEFDFDSLSPFYKMKVIKSLMDWHLCDYTPVHQLVTENKTIGPRPLGRDELGAVYYHFDKNEPLVFAERFFQASETVNLPVSEFSLLCRTLGELKQLLDDLKTRHTSKYVHGDTKSLYYELQSLIEATETRERIKHERELALERQQQRRLERLETQRLKRLEQRRSARIGSSRSSSDISDVAITRRSSRIAGQWREQFSMNSESTASDVQSEAAPEEPQVQNDDFEAQSNSEDEDFVAQTESGNQSEASEESM